MQYGINLLLWADRLHDGLLPILDEVKQVGYDLVEIPCFGANSLEEHTAWGKRFDAAGLGRTAVTVRGAEENMISADAAVRRRGIHANKQALDCCAAAGCAILAGPMHSAIGLFSGAGPTADEWQWGVESMREVAAYAATVGVTITVEYLNRFECYFLNTAADAARFCREVNHPNCRMMYDTFHAHIEEKNTPAAIRAAAPYLGHVHISENDRSTPGQGNVGWKQTFDTLQEIDYDGTMVVEAFGAALPGIAAATKIWRRMFDSERQLITDALTFMKTEVAKRTK